MERDGTTPPTISRLCPATAPTIMLVFFTIIFGLKGFENIEFGIENSGLIDCEFNEKFYYFGGLLTPYPPTPTHPKPNPTPCPTYHTRAPTPYPRGKSGFGM